jgi:hypothetical protein
MYNKDLEDIKSHLHDLNERDANRRRDEIYGHIEPGGGEGLLFFAIVLLFMGVLPVAMGLLYLLIFNQSIETSNFEKALPILVISEAIGFYIVKRIFRSWKNEKGNS